MANYLEERNWQSLHYRDQIMRRQPESRLELSKSCPSLVHLVINFTGSATGSKRLCAVGEFSKLTS